MSFPWRQVSEENQSSSPKVRVCLVGPSLDILGGQAVQAQRLLTALSSSDRLTVDFLPVNPRLPGLLASLQRIKYVRTIVTSIAYLGSLVRHARRNDVLHAFSASYWSYLLAPFPALAIGRLFGCHTVLNYRSGEAEDHLANWRTAVPTMERFADRIVVPSGYLVEVFGRFGLRARAIANFVDLERLPYRRRETLTPRFLSNRNLEPLYNVGCTIRAFGRIQARVPDAALTIAGDGSQRAELESLVATLGLRHVRFVGRVRPEDMGALYDTHDVYLNSPNIDNMPGSIIEAFACGLPVVSTDAGGIPFVVDNGVNGTLVKSGDSEAMADAVLRLLEAPAIADGMAVRARRECESRYVWHAVRRQWESLYLELVSG